MAYGLNSTNPRERRAFADNKLAQLKHGEATYQETYEAIHAASNTRKGKESGYTQRLAASGVVLFDWAATIYERPGIIQHNFGGYVMPKADAEHWAMLGRHIKSLVDMRDPRDFDAPQDPRLNALHGEHNKRFHMGYEAVKFTSMFRGTHFDGYDAFPGLDDTINPLEYESVTPFIAANDEAAVQARIAQL